MSSFKLKNLVIAFTSICFSTTSFSQQIGSGFPASTITDFNIEMPSGFYQGLYAQGEVDGSGWTHLLNLRHSNTANNHQLQIASSYTENDRMFFRKFAAGLGARNPTWYEIATRGANTFTGQISISGTNALSFSSYGGGFYMGDTEWIRTFGNKSFYQNTGVMRTDGILQVGPSGDRFVVNPDGNVGIGTTTPSAKFNIEGSHSETKLLLHSTGAYDLARQADLMLWASEPGVSYTGVGIGNNVVNSNPTFSRITNSRGGSYMRLLENAINFNTISNTGVDKQVMKLDENGNVGIATTTPTHKLTVNGTVRSSEVIVDATITPDYVFQKYFTGSSDLKKDYNMPSLAEVEAYAKQNNHLPGVPSAAETAKNGLVLGEMSNILLQKIEELTLYVIEQNKEIAKLKTANQQLQNLAERVAAFEETLKK